MAQPPFLSATSHASYVKSACHLRMSCVVFMLLSMSAARRPKTSTTRIPQMQIELMQARIKTCILYIYVCIHTDIYTYILSERDIYKTCICIHISIFTCFTSRETGRSPPTAVLKSTNALNLRQRGEDKLRSGQGRMPGCGCRV